MQMQFNSIVSPTQYFCCLATQIEIWTILRSRSIFYYSNSWVVICIQNGFILISFKLVNWIDFQLSFFRVFCVARLKASQHRQSSWAWCYKHKSGRIYRTNLLNQKNRCYKTQKTEKNLESEDLVAEWRNLRLTNVINNPDVRRQKIFSDPKFFFNGKNSVL
jgi:hypothetical protein